MNQLDHAKWAAAIAQRISEEWSGSRASPDDAELLRTLLEKMLSRDIESVAALIGTGIIESDYFESLM